MSLAGHLFFCKIKSKIDQACAHIRQSQSLKQMTLQTHRTSRRAEFLSLIFQGNNLMFGQTLSAVCMFYS